MATRSASPKNQPGVDTDIKLQLAPNPGFGDQSRVMSSRTWSYASGDLQQCNTKNDIDDRNIFVQEYNRLAEKVRQSKVDFRDHTDDLLAWDSFSHLGR